MKDWLFNMPWCHPRAKGGVAFTPLAMFAGLLFLVPALAAFRHMAAALAVAVCSVVLVMVVVVVGVDVVVISEAVVVVVMGVLVVACQTQG